MFDTSSDFSNILPAAFGWEQQFHASWAPQFCEYMNEIFLNLPKLLSGDWAWLCAELVCFAFESFCWRSAQNEIHVHVFPGMFQYIREILLFWSILIDWAVKILKYAHFSLSLPVLRANTTAQTLQTWLSLSYLKTDLLLIRFFSYLRSFTLLSFTSGDYLPD